MSLPEIPHSLTQELSNFLRVLRSEWMRRIQGIPDRMERVVTFNDLVALGLATESEAKKQAEK